MEADYGAIVCYSEDEGGEDEDYDEDKDGERSDDLQDCDSDDGYSEDGGDEDDVWEILSEQVGRKRENSVNKQKSLGCPGEDAASSDAGENRCDDEGLANKKKDKEQGKSKSRKAFELNYQLVGLRAGSPPKQREKNPGRMTFPYFMNEGDAAKQKYKKHSRSVLARSLERETADKSLCAQKVEKFLLCNVELEGGNLGGQKAALLGNKGDQVGGGCSDTCILAHAQYLVRRSRRELLTTIKDVRTCGRGRAITTISCWVGLGQTWVRRGRRSGWGRCRQHRQASTETRGCCDACVDCRASCTYAPHPREYLAGNLQFVVEETRAILLQSLPSAARRRPDLELIFNQQASSVAPVRSTELIRVEFDVQHATMQTSRRQEANMRLCCSAFYSHPSPQAQLRSGAIFLVTCRRQHQQGKPELLEFFAAMAESAPRKKSDVVVALWVHRKHSERLQSIAPNADLRAFYLCSVLSEARIFACCSKPVKCPLLTCMMVCFCAPPGCRMTLFPSGSLLLRVHPVCVLQRRRRKPAKTVPTTTAAASLQVSYAKELAGLYPAQREAFLRFMESAHSDPVVSKKMRGKSPACAALPCPALPCPALPSPYFLPALDTLSCRAEKLSTSEWDPTPA
eukprot:749760-Hanusia_phi.AAC.1